MSTKEEVIRFYTLKIADLEHQIQAIEVAEDKLVKEHSKHKNAITENEKKQYDSKRTMYVGLLEPLYEKLDKMEKELKKAKAGLSGGRRIKKSKRVQRKRKTKRTRKH